MAKSYNYPKALLDVYVYSGRTEDQLIRDFWFLSSVFLLLNLLNVSNTTFTLFGNNICIIMWN